MLDRTTRELTDWGTRIGHPQDKNVWSEIFKGADAGECFRCASFVRRKGTSVVGNATGTCPGNELWRRLQTLTVAHRPCPGMGLPGATVGSPRKLKGFSVIQRNALLSALTISNMDTSINGEWRGGGGDCALVSEQYELSLRWRPGVKLTRCPIWIHVEVRMRQFEKRWSLNLSPLRAAAPAVLHRSVGLWLGDRQKIISH